MNKAAQALRRYSEDELRARGARVDRCIWNAKTHEAVKRLVAWRDDISNEWRRREDGRQRPIFTNRATYDFGWLLGWRGLS